MNGILLLIGQEKETLRYTRCGGFCLTGEPAGTAMSPPSSVDGSLDSVTPPSPPGRMPRDGAQIWRVAITGGPCGGKTTAMAEVSERLRSRGVNTFVVPEAATLLFTGGASVLDLSNKRHCLAFQTQLLKTQLSLEESFFKIAKAANAPAVLLCDRGAMDGKAYMTSTLWKQLLTTTGFREGELRDARYDLVVHMVTAADGAPSFYTTVNNQARRESMKEAIQQDKRTRDAWTGHAHLRIVDNRTGFHSKINRVFNLIADLVGVPAPTWLVRKFLVSHMTRPPGLKEFDVKQTFLKRSHGEVESVRVRCDGRTRNFMHKVSFERPRYNTKRQITNREYLSLLVHADAERRMISIRRTCFAFGSNYFVLDEILNVEPTLRLVRCHVEEGCEVTFPDWLTVASEVTGEPEYTGKFSRVSGYSVHLGYYLHTPRQRSRRFVATFHSLTICESLFSISSNRTKQAA